MWHQTVLAACIVLFFDIYGWQRGSLMNNYIFSPIFLPYGLIAVFEVGLWLRKNLSLHRKCKIWKTKNIILTLRHIRSELCFWKCKKYLFWASLEISAHRLIFSKVLEKDTNTYKMMGISYKKLLELHCLGCSVFTDHVGVRLVQEKPINDALLWKKCEFL